MALLWLLSCFTFIGASLGSGAPASELELSIKPRIINGEDTASGSWPWHVSLENSPGSLFCGGSLISKNWVITAAHCNATTSDFVVIGRSDLYAPGNDYQILRISQVFNHPKSDWNTVYNDIALLKLEKAAHFHQRVFSAILPSADDQFLPGTLCTIIGWGETSPNCSKKPDKLQQASMPLLSLATCRKYWPGVINNSLICAGLSGSSFYSGDSGGSLTCKKRGVWTLVGVMAFVSKTHPINKPVVATRVSKFLPWIEEILAHN